MNLICRIGWCGESPYLADQLVHQPTAEQKEDKEEAKSQLEKAREFLTNVLAEGPRPVKWCRAEANKVGLSGRTLERAAKGLKLVLDYFNDAADGEHTWSLPAPFEHGEMAS
jgi:putative DNA primase/helicase